MRRLSRKARQDLPGAVTLSGVNHSPVTFSGGVANSAAGYPLLSPREKKRRFRPLACIGKGGDSGGCEGFPAGHQVYRLPRGGLKSGKGCGFPRLPW